ncbi:MAG: efflux RND transporter periplasmic adaptor subunit [Bryobacter sp.]|nr:efflux RND transporter periplasmic adaptor subunit [Bryobacter sp.]
MNQILLLGLVAALLQWGCGKPAAPEMAKPQSSTAAAPPALSPVASSPVALSPVALSPAALRHAGVEVVTVRREAVGGALEAPGKLTWSEDHTVSVGVVATGRVMHVYAKAGDRVEAQQLLARMHTHDVHDTKALLRQAMAERDRATTALEQARRTEARMRRLLELKAISEAQFEQAVLERRTAESLVRVARASVDKEVAHLEEFLEIPAAAASALEEEARSGEAQHEEEDELVPVKAAASGIIVARRITPGTVVNIGQEAFVISDPSRLWCLASFPESALPRLRVGAKAEVEVRAYPGRRFPARIVRLGDTIDPDTRTLQVRLELASQGALKPEMLATVRVPLATATELIVPESALQNLDGQTVVFLETKAGEFTPRTVEVEVRNGLALVRAGLAEGDRVAANGSYALKGELLKEASR